MGEVSAADADADADALAVFGNGASMVIDESKMKIPQGCQMLGE